MKQSKVTIKKVKYITRYEDRMVRLIHQDGYVTIGWEEYHNLLRILSKRTLRGMNAIIENRCADCLARYHYQCSQVITVDGREASLRYCCCVADM